MGGMNFRGAYQLDPADSDDRYANGLLGRLQAIMQQGQMQSNADFNATNSDGSSQDNLPERSAVLQGTQSRDQPIAVSNVQPSSTSRDPNFRQLRRVYITDRAPDRIDSDRSGNYSDYTSQAPASNVGTTPPTFKMAQVPLPFRPSLPPPVRVLVPPIPMPKVPDSLKAAGAILQLYPRMLSYLMGHEGNTFTAQNGNRFSNVTNGPSSPSTADSGSLEGGISPPSTMPVPPPPIYMQANPRSGRAVSKSSRITSSIGRGGGDDDENVCDIRRRAEEGRCYARWANDEYAHEDWLPACIKRAETRWDLCNRNGYRIPRFEPEEWKLDPDEEVWYNERRRGLLRRDD